MRLYLETSVWNFLFVQDSPEKRKATESLLLEISEGKHEPFISAVVIAEVENTPDADLQSRLLSKIREVEPAIIPSSPGIEVVTERLVMDRIIPERYRNDALHIAFALAAEVEALVSWNMKHIVRHKTRQFVRAQALLIGLREMDLVTPEEVIEA